MKREKKLLLQRRKGLSLQLDVALDKINQPLTLQERAENAVKIQSLLSQISMTNQMLHTLKKSQMPIKQSWENDPALIELNKKLFSNVQVVSSLKCPKCGDINHGNVLNGKPWCFKCKSVLKVC